MTLRLCQHFIGNLPLNFLLSFSTISVLFYFLQQCFCKRSSRSCLYRISHGYMHIYHIYIRIPFPIFLWRFRCAQRCYCLCHPDIEYQAFRIPVYRFCQFFVFLPAAPAALSCVSGMRSALLCYYLDTDFNCLIEKSLILPFAVKNIISFFFRQSKCLY